MLSPLIEDVLSWTTIREESSNATLIRIYDQGPEFLKVLFLTSSDSWLSCQPENSKRKSYLNIAMTVGQQG